MITSEVIKANDNINDALNTLATTATATWIKNDLRTKQEISKILRKANQDIHKFNELLDDRINKEHFGITVCGKKVKR